MLRKPPPEERRIILARDQRRKYGAELVFQVQRAEHIGELENVTLLIEDGTLATIEPGRISTWEGGKRYIMKIKGFATAREAEDAGMQTAQALLLTAVSLNFGLRLNYHSHEPPTVFDRTVSKGATLSAEGFGTYSQEIVLNELNTALKIPLENRRLSLSMELFVAAALESNDRARFVMAVSALEPLATQENLGEEVSSFVEELQISLDENSSITGPLRDSLKGRLSQLKKESIRQSLKRLSAGWFPDDKEAWKRLDRAYSLRSEMLHEGRPNDLDTLLTEEIQSVSNLLRSIYQKVFNHALRAPVAA